MSVLEFEQATAPFAPAQVLSASGGGPTSSVETGGLRSPFAQSLEVDPEGEAETVDLLRAQLEDEGFDEALEALTDEAAGRHLRSVATWYSESEAPVLAATEVERWLESLATESDRVLGALESHFADRSADSLQDGELEAASGYSGWETAPFTAPGDAQEQFVKSLLGKAKKAAQGIANVAKKGLAAIGKVLPLGKLFGILRKLVHPLLRRVLRTAIGKLPASLRPLATRLATRFGGASESAADVEEAEAETLAEAFDRQVAELALASNDAALEHRMAELEAEAGIGSPSVPGDDVQHRLDVARARLARELASAQPGEPPTAQMEQFIPAVMAAMPLVRAGVRLAGRGRVQGIVASAVAKLIKGMVGDQAATALSRHIADTGLKLLGLEAEDGYSSTLGTEALVAAAEDTVRQVMSLPAESTQDDRLLEAEVQEAFSEAAVRHLPAAVLRPELVEREYGEEEHGLWLMMPRATRPNFRYKKYSRIIPVRISRPAARAVVLSGGDTLERRLLDEGAEHWPVTGEMEVYELLDGAALGHLAAFESEAADDVAAAATEFEELTENAAAVLAQNPRLADTGRLGRPSAGRRLGLRYYRLRVAGRPLRRRNALSLRLDLTAPRPVLTVHVRVGEREAHALAGHLERQQMAQVLSVVRGLLHPGARLVMGRRLERMLTARGVPPAAGAARRLAERLSDAMVRAVSQQLPAAAPALAQAAKDAASGATLSFGFSFPDKASIATADPEGPTLSIRPGAVRG